VDLLKQRKRVTILGLGTSIYSWIDHMWQTFDVESEVWTINAGAACYRHDIIFDMHTDRYIAQLGDDDTQIRVRKRREWLKTHDRPIVMPKATKEFPTSVTYPLNAVYERSHSMYFATGIAYMFALAYTCDVEELMCFGCDFSYKRDTNTHDEQGRACAEYWVGRLIEKGCKVGFSSDTHFMDAARRSEGRIYGYDEKVEMDFPTDGKGYAKLVTPNYS
jgi:hypothetical protein